MSLFFFFTDFFVITFFSFYGCTPPITSAEGGEIKQSATKNGQFLVLQQKKKEHPKAKNIVTPILHHTQIFLPRDKHNTDVVLEVFR